MKTISQGSYETVPGTYARSSEDALAVLIPSFEPDGALVNLVRELHVEFEVIVVVDDGSGPNYRQHFDELEQLYGVSVLRHDDNRGKGAALKTGIGYILTSYPDCAGIVTADADGQHHSDDVKRVAQSLAQNRDDLSLGAREFNGDTPLRSRIGNLFTRNVFRLIHSVVCRDTQTGLRGIPRSFAPTLLKLPSDRYEFESDMLIAASNARVRFREVPIQTIYIDSNRSSHFSPVVDSMRIYFVLLRFAGASATTAAIDNILFYLLFVNGRDALSAQWIARAFAFFISYRLNRRVVFRSQASGDLAWLRFAAVVLLSGAASYLALQTLRTVYGWNVFAAKATSESALFLFNFAFLRDFVFRARTEEPKATNWNDYYHSVPFTARLTRRYTTRTLIRALALHQLPARGSRILEFGGGNSCFLKALAAKFRPAAYHVADNNERSLHLLRQRLPEECSVELYNTSILAPSTLIPAGFDLVYSVGLVEHFDTAGTAEAIRSHFRYAAPGGLVLISFPRPTALYRVARRFLEMARLWKFHDERPLQPAEVLRTVEEYGEVVFQKTLWPLVLTQHMVVVKATKV